MMGIVNLARQAEEWAEGELRKQALGEEFGYAISLQQAVVPTAQGPAQVPMLGAAAHHEEPGARRRAAVSRAGAGRVARAG
jgi:hypothetical protein